LVFVEELNGPVIERKRNPVSSDCHPWRRFQLAGVAGAITAWGMLASNEIIRKSRLAQESVRRALIDLVSLGIVLSSGMGRSSVYLLNADHASMPERLVQSALSDGGSIAVLENVQWRLLPNGGLS
jgi:hypothetical protein